MNIIMNSLLTHLEGLNDRDVTKLLRDRQGSLSSLHEFMVDHENHDHAD